MQLAELIDLAGAKRGSLGNLAAEMHRHQTRLSEWKSGKRKPETSEIAYLADVAGLPIVDTVTEMESQLRPDYAEIWKKAVRELRQNQG